MELVASTSTPFVSSTGRGPDRVTDWAKKDAEQQAEIRARLRLPKHIECWDDERDIGNGIIVTLHLGWSFEQSHEGVRGFDTVTEAREGTRKKWLYRCPADCDECEFHRLRPKEYLASKETR